MRGLTSATEALLTIEPLDDAIQQTLAFLGQATQVDRVYVYQAKPCADSPALTWCQRWYWGDAPPLPGADKPPFEGPPLSDLTCSQDLSRWVAELLAGRAIHGPATHFPLSEQRQLEQLGIRSILMVPIYSQEEFWGLLGLDDCRQARSWTLTDLSTLGAVAGSLGGAIARDAATQSLQALNHALQAQLEQKELALDLAEDLADQAAQTKRALVSCMGQQLSQPLTGMLNEAQQLHRSPHLGAAEQRGVATIYERGAQALLLLNKILDLTHLGAHELVLEPVSLHFPSFLQGIVERCRDSANQKGLLFVYQPSPQLPNAVKVDGQRLRQVLVQLLETAVQATQSGQITFSVEVLVHQLSPLPIRDHLRFSVVDESAGLSQEVRDRLLQAFDLPVETLESWLRNCPQLSHSNTLGIVISQKIINLMGGTFTLESKPEAGNRLAFEIELPLDPEWQRQALRAARVIGYEGDRRRILVVDDRWENRSVLVSLLEALGFEMFEAIDGTAALAQLAASRPDLVITDLVMPNLDGFALLRQMRAHPEWQSLPILVSSASVDLSEQRRSLAEGGDDFLTKPIQVSELLLLLQKHLGLTWCYAS